MKKFKGLNTNEVWDYRLSSAVPGINRKSGTWVAEIWSKNNLALAEGDAVASPLEYFDTGIEAVEGDEYDVKKVKACFEWFYSVRDNYSLEDIEQRKPLVAKINAANKALADLGAV